MRTRAKRRRRLPRPSRTPLKSSTSSRQMTAPWSSPRWQRTLPGVAPGAGAAAALSQLAEVYKARRRVNEFPLGGAAQTLEDVVRQMLQPMLQGWVDSKLPGIVERLIAAELSRVVGEAVSA